MITTDAAVASDQTWNEQEHLDICSDVDDPSAGDTCTLCPALLSGVSGWDCCHDPRVFDDCTTAVANTLEDSDNAADKRRTKYFLGKKRGVKYFLGKRSRMPPYYDRQLLAQELGLRRPQNNGGPDKRVKYFLG